MLKKYRIFALFLVLLVNSCGTLMYPERKDQFLSKKKVDLSVVLLNAASFFIFPPLIFVNFAVDIKNKTIFLPTDEVLLYENTPQNIQAEKENQRILKEQEKIRLANEEEERKQKELEQKEDPYQETVVEEAVDYNDTNLFN